MNHASGRQLVLVENMVLENRGTSESIGELLSPDGARNLSTFLQGNLMDVDTEALWRVCNPGFTRHITSCRFRTPIREQIATLVQMGAQEDAVSGWSTAMLTASEGGDWVHWASEFYRPNCSRTTREVEILLRHRRRKFEDRTEAFIGILRNFMDISAQGGYKPPETELVIAAPGCALGVMVPLAHITPKREVRIWAEDDPGEGGWDRKVRFLCHRKERHEE